MSTPSPRRPRHDGWTQPRRHAFLAELAAGSTVVAAARAVGLSKPGAYKRRAADPAFAAAWDAAQTAGATAIERTTLRLAIEGWSEPVTYHGRIVGHRPRHDTRLLLHLLKRQDRRDARTERRAEWEANHPSPKRFP